MLDTLMENEGFGSIFSSDGSQESEKERGIALRDFSLLILSAAAGSCGPPCFIPDSFSACRTISSMQKRRCWSIDALEVNHVQSRRPA
jgi:hypothetical protein